MFACFIHCTFISEANFYSGFAGLLLHYSYYFFTPPMEHKAATTPRHWIWFWAPLPSWVHGSFFMLAAFFWISLLTVIQFFILKKFKLTSTLIHEIILHHSFYNMFFFFTSQGCCPELNSLSWRTHWLHFIWLLLIGLSDLGGPARGFGLSLSLSDLRRMVVTKCY